MSNFIRNRPHLSGSAHTENCVFSPNPPNGLFLLHINYERAHGRICVQSWFWKRICQFNLIVSFPETQVENQFPPTQENIPCSGLLLPLDVWISDD